MTKVQHTWHKLQLGYKQRDSCIQESDIEQQVRVQVRVLVREQEQAEVLVEVKERAEVLVEVKERAEVLVEGQELVSAGGWMLL